MILTSLKTITMRMKTHPKMHTHNHKLFYVYATL